MLARRVLLFAKPRQQSCASSDPLLLVETLQRHRVPLTRILIALAVLGTARCFHEEDTPSRRKRHSWVLSSTRLLEPRSCFADNPLKFEAVCSRNGTAVP